MQGAETSEITLEILSSVLQVYVMAEDFEEAVSVSKRIRAIVKEGVDNGDAEIPTRETYSCMIKAYCAYGQPNEALRALEEMRIHKVHASTETYTTLLKSMSSPAESRRSEAHYRSGQCRQQYACQWTGWQQQSAIAAGHCLLQCPDRGIRACRQPRARAAGVGDDATARREAR
ncbi:hypothetical protein DL89DRAFT_109181 [Linderina pennispora]|uniref:Pentacotripeptide-repeat region of PRORP domain-containing protein n=1 Tax=Linderina pennispora TaxID=61395 RepID=A0A1Y1WF29_9FUNG|nr:uncharacterized protein DL89DRAFT_109181 [Linderina pennispora]ORX72151.1 hypothetical protein DL89DRAFT_109181 [Linderina pennispora]